MIKEDDPNYNKVLKRLLNGFNKVEPTTGGYNRIVKVDRHPEAKDDKDYAAFTETLPNNLKPREDSSYDMYRYWVLMGRPKDFNEGIDRNMFSEVTDNNGTFYHAGSVARNPETGNYEFMKHSSHPNHYMELAWYNSNDPKAKAFKNEYEYVPGADGWD
jgi:hypothetical protein